MESGLPISMSAATSGNRNPNGAANGNNSFVAAAAALAAAAAASQQHIFNAAMRAAAVSSAPFNAVGVDPGSGGSNSPLSVQLDYAPETAEAKLIDYRQEKVAAFEIDGETMMCLPQAYELFLKNLVGGLHTVYTKLKRLEIAPFVCNVEQVRALRSIGAIQPGVNRCKLISCRDFDVLYEDCASSSSRPGRPPKRSPIFAASATMAPSAVPASGVSIASNNGYPIGGTVSDGFGIGNTPVTSSYAPVAKRSRLSESGAVSALEKFNTAFNPMAGFMNTAAVVGGNPLNPNQLFPLFPFAPQNFVFSHLMNANPNASLLAKQWGEQFNALSTSNGGTDTAIDATTKGDDGQSGESAQNVSANAIGLNRSDRNPSWTSTGGRESEDLLKFPTSGNACEPLVAHDIGISVNGIFDRHGSGDDGNEENGGNSSDFEDANAAQSSADDAERKESEKDDDNDQEANRWASVSTATANGGTEASQLLRSMVDLGVSSQFFGGPSGLAAAAAAAAAQQSGRQRPAPFSGLQPNDQSHYSSVESILMSVLGLVQVAASTARAHEEQLSKEKVEAVRMYETEKQERARLEQVLRHERHWKAVYLKRMKKERRQNVELSEKMRVLAEKVGKEWKEGTVHVLTSPDSAIKPSNVANGGRSTTFAEMSPPFRPPKSASFSASKRANASADRRERASSDGDKHESATPSRLPLENNVAACEAMTESREDALEGCSERSRNGRTATLFIKNELS